MMESVTLVKSSQDLCYDATKCIICQKVGDDKTASTSNGCKRIREASGIHNDHVSKRLKLVEGDGFCYHVTNECYKKYTMKTVLDRITKKNLVQGQDSSFSQQNKTEGRSSRSQAVRHRPNADTTATGLRVVNCIICDNKSYKQLYTKCRISESNRAMSFLAATNFFQDSVFDRTCDLQDPHSVFGADLYYHNECMTKYMYKYESRSQD